jgi:hypothetical protein
MSGILSPKQFFDWINLELYLAARDSATIRLGVLSEVYVKHYGKKPDLERIEFNYGENAASGKTCWVRKKGT